MEYCPKCLCQSHGSHPCGKRTGLTGQERAEAERRFERGRIKIDPDDTRDLWRDGW